MTRTEIFEEAKDIGKNAAIGFLIATTALGSFYAYDTNITQPNKQNMQDVLTDDFKNAVLKLEDQNRLSLQQPTGEKAVYNFLTGEIEQEVEGPKDTYKTIGTFDISEHADMKADGCKLSLQATEHFQNKAKDTSLFHYEEDGLDASMGFQLNHCEM